MFIERHIPHRQKDEKLVLFLRRHWITLLAQWLAYFVLILIPICIYFFLINFQPGVLSNEVLFIFLFLLASLYYLFIWLFFFNAFIDYYLDVWIVTNQRIINVEQKGMFNREIAEHNLDRIQDVTGSQKGFFQTFFSYGDVHIQTAGEVQRFIFRNVNNPFDVSKTINDLIKQHEDKFNRQLLDKLKKKD